MHPEILRNSRSADLDLSPLREFGGNWALFTYYFIDGYKTVEFVRTAWRDGRRRVGFAFRNNSGDKICLDTTWESLRVGRHSYQISRQKGEPMEFDPKSYHRFQREQHLVVKSPRVPVETVLEHLVAEVQPQTVA